jgi:hypothetical protein
MRCARKKNDKRIVRKSLWWKYRGRSKINILGDSEGNRMWSPCNDGAKSDVDREGALTWECSAAGHHGKWSATSWGAREPLHGAAGVAERDHRTL